MTRQQKHVLNTFLRYLVLTVVGLIMVYPMIWMLGASFKSSNAEIFSSIGFIPKKPTFQGYIDGWKGVEYSFGVYMFNTYKFVIPKVIGTIISAVITGYGFSRFKFKGQKFLFSVCLATLFLPQVVLNVPQFLLFRDLDAFVKSIGINLNILDSYIPIVLPSFFAVDTYFVFMLVQFMRSISRELEEAAEIDGCNSIQRLWYVIVPMVKPTVVSCALFQFMWSSNDFMGPLIYVNSTNKFSASLGLRLLMDADTGIVWNKILALSIITILPSLVVFFLAQNQFVDGISAGGVKG